MRVLKPELQFLVYWEQNEKDRHVVFGILPYVVIRSLETDAFMAIVAHTDMPMVSRNLAKGRKKRATQGAVVILKENKVQGCVSYNSDPKKSILRKAGDLRSNASAGYTIKFSGSTWYHVLNRE